MQKQSLKILKLSPLSQKFARFILVVKLNLYRYKLLSQQLKIKIFNQSNIAEN